MTFTHNNDFQLENYSGACTCFTRLQIYCFILYTSVICFAIWIYVVPWYSMADHNWFPVSKNLKKVVYPWFFYIQFSFIFSKLHSLTLLRKKWCLVSHESYTTITGRSCAYKYRARLGVCNLSIWDPNFMPHFCFNHCTFSWRVTHVGRKYGPIRTRKFMILNWKFNYMIKWKLRLFKVARKLGVAPFTLLYFTLA